MSNLPLQPLNWQRIDREKLAGIYCEKTHSYIKDAVSFCSTPVADYVIRKDKETGKYSANYGGRNENTYDTIDEAEHWAEHTHYRDKMQPYVKPTTLADAVNILVDACHGASVKGGWWHDLATGEGVRKGINDDHLPQYPMEDVEMADALIRIFDYIGGHKLQTADALVDKLTYNASRADHKLENRIKDGGKKL